MKKWKNIFKDFEDQDHFNVIIVFKRYVRLRIMCVFKAIKRYEFPVLSNFRISQPKQMFSVLKRAVSMRRFF